MTVAHLLRFWGRDEEQLRQSLPKTIPYRHETNDDSPWVAWFPNAEARASFMASKSPDWCVVFDVKDISRPRLTLSTVVLRFDGKDHTCKDDYGFGYPFSSVEYTWNEGNYSCDCNKRLWLNRQHGVPLPEGGEQCGDTIKLVSLKVEHGEEWVLG